jgi:hypothetical protein
MRHQPVGGALLLNLYTHVDPVAAAVAVAAAVRGYLFLITVLLMSPDLHPEGVRA